MEWPKVKVLSTKSFTEYKFIGGSWLAMLMCYTMLGSLFIPYFIVLGKGNLDPFLPYVSQASGSPPQSGVFNIFLVASSFLAFIGLNLFHMGIRIQKKRLEDPWVRNTASLLNKIALIPGHAGILGMIIVGSFPMDFHRSSDSWMTETIIPHLIGALSVFIGGLFYCIIITYIMALIHPEQKQLLGIRIFLICLITMCSALQGYTLRDAFMGEFVDENRLRNCVVDANHVKYNMSYLVSSVCEWSLLVCFIVFFMTFREQGNDFCLTLSMTLMEDETIKQSKIEAEEIKKEESNNHETQEKQPNGIENREHS